MSTTELDDSRRLSSTLVYHVNPLHHKTQEDLLFNQTGPDVTLATNAVSSLNIYHPHLSQEQESPDLVTIGSETLGATALYDGTLRQFWKNPSSQNPSVRKMSHSYCTGPSHMYL